MALARELIRFGAVGTLGFVVDGGVLSMLVSGLAWGPLAARLISMPVAVLVTWWLHRHWTFAGGRNRRIGSQWLIYTGVQLTGMALNYGVFAGAVALGGVWRELPVLAVAAGSVTAMAVTFILSKKIAFA